MSGYNQSRSTMDGAEKAEAVDESLLANFRQSYHRLSEIEQQIFLDVATFFGGNENWTLRDALMAWTVAYQTESPELMWKTLVDGSLVHNVNHDEHIKVDSQLQSLGRKIASELSNKGRRRIWDKTTALELLQTTHELDGQIYSLRLGTEEDGQEQNNDEIHMTSIALPQLEQLRFFEVNLPIVVDVAQECELFPSKLVLLRCHAPELFQLLLHPAPQTDIVILDVSCKATSCLPETLWCFSKLRKFILSSGSYIESIPKAIELLSKLQILEFHNCPRLKTLPETIGNLSYLIRLKFEGCISLTSLPNSFGQLSSLSHLEFKSCTALHSLPESFGQLSSLSHLELKNCTELHGLPESFWQLSSLSHLEFNICNSLHALSESFGQLSSLSHLEFENCMELHALPESFGQLSSLSHLEFKNCMELHALPESFGQLSSLSHLELKNCTELHGLPESFGQLSSLSHLEFKNCMELHALSESFGQLSSLSHLEFENCMELHALPESFGQLSSLSHLEFKNCMELHALPESFGQLSSLSHLEFKMCTVLCALPESFGRLSSLKHLEFVGCWKLHALPESFGQLSSLKHLEFVGCRKLHALPESFGQLSSLSQLEFNNCNSLHALPESFGQLSSLSHLKFDMCTVLCDLPESFGQLSSLKHLEFLGCWKLHALPQSFIQLSSLEHNDVFKSYPRENRLLGPSRDLGLPISIPKRPGETDEFVFEQSMRKMEHRFFGKARSAKVEAENFEKKTSRIWTRKSSSTEGGRALETTNSEANEREIGKNTHAQDFRVSDKDSNYERRTKEAECDSTEKLSELVKAFIAEVQKWDEGGFVVSAEWLHSLEEHEKEVLLSVLLRTGFSEVYQTTTTVLYQRLDQDSVDTSNVPLLSDSSSAGFTTKHVEEMGSSSLDTEKEANTDSNLSTLQGKEKLTVSVEQVSTRVRPFIAALKENGHRSYGVSTEWLSNLESYEKKMLESTCKETGMRTFQIGSTTHYRRIEDHVSASNDSSYRDASSDRSRPVDGPSTSGGYTQGGDLDPKELRNLSINDESDGSPCTSTSSQPRTKSADSTKCVPQLLKVTCTADRRSPSETSTSPSESVSGPSSIYSRDERLIREPCGDSFVTLPNPNRRKEGYSFVSTTVEKDIEVESYEYKNKELVAVLVDVKALVQTTVSCCLKHDSNPKKVRVKVSHIRGEIEHLDNKKPTIRDLVLESVYTNVDAFIDPDGEGIELASHEIYRNHPFRIVYSERDESGKLVDQVWLKHSDNNPKGCQSGSITMGLQCDAHKRRLIGRDPVLNFQDATCPVTLEGETEMLTGRVLKLDIKFRLRFSHVKPVVSTSGSPFCRTIETNQDIDFKCRLQISGQKLSS